MKRENKLKPYPGALSRTYLCLSRASLVLGFVCLAGSMVDGTTQDAADAPEAREQSGDFDDHYRKGRELLEQSNWAEASNAFTQAAKSGNEKADGALYWKAYAEFKGGRREEALKTLGELKKRYPESRYKDDAHALSVEVRQASGQEVSVEGEPGDELKLIVIQGLLHTDQEKAIPLLQKLLATNQTPRVKEKALFVLSQSPSPKAREIMSDLARGKGDANLRFKALEYTALFGGEKSRELLADIYTESSDNKIKRRILGFFMIAGDRERLLTAARGEKSPELRGEAVSQLGVMGAQDQLVQLYQSESDLRVRKKIIDALFVSGAGEKVADLARTETNSELQLEAIEKLGLLKADKSSATLKELYSRAKDKKVRRKIIEAFYLQGDAKTLVEMARSEQDKEMKKKIVEQLSIMNKPEGTEYLMEILKD